MIAAPIVFPLRSKRVLVTGHRGMVGSALVRRLRVANCEVQTLGRETADLRSQSQTEAALERLAPDAVFIASARVGGIRANSMRPAEFLYDNLMIAANLIEAARRMKVQKLMFLGSSCIYPRMAKQPISEDELLAGPLEPSNQWYAISKIAGLKLCGAYRRQYGSDFISVQPTNLYGPGDNFDLETSHALAALMVKAYRAKQGETADIEIWGTGSPRREFLHVDDLADALVFLMERYSAEEHINIGYGSDVTIEELARMISDVVGFKGPLRFDRTKGDGTPRKLLDSSRLNSLGWQPRISLQEGLASTYAWYLDNKA